MPEVMTIEGIRLPGDNPGKRYEKLAAIREVIKVRPSRKDPSVCAIAQFGSKGQAGGKRMVDLCREAGGFKKMQVGATVIDITSKKPAHKLAAVRTEKAESKAAEQQPAEYKSKSKSKPAKGVKQIGKKAVEDPEAFKRPETVQEFLSETEKQYALIEKLPGGKRVAEDLRERSALVGWKPEKAYDIVMEAYSRLNREARGMKEVPEDLEGTMGDYDAMEFPAIESFDEFEGLLNRDGAMNAGIAALGNIGQKVIRDLSKLIPPTIPMAQYAIPLLRTGAGIALANALWSRYPQASIGMVAEALGQIVYEDVVRGFLYKATESFKMLQPAFGTVEVSRSRMLEGLTRAELDTLGLGSTSVERQELGSTATVERPNELAGTRFGRLPIAALRS